MAYTPRTMIANCKCNHAAPDKAEFSKTWGIFPGREVRLSCYCGISGMWIRYHGDGDPWHTARVGWDALFGDPPMPTARPKP